MAITHTFSAGTLEVFKDGVIQLYQPFKPTSTGDQPAWADEAEALEWLFHEESSQARFSSEELADYKNSLGA
jgi:hypothetical protein